MTDPHYAEYYALPDYQLAKFLKGEVEDDGTGRPRWSGDHAVPALRSRVKITINQLGAGVVVGYFVEDGWLGILVVLDNRTRPDWHRKQNGERPGPSHIFGTEFKPET